MKMWFRSIQCKENWRESGTEPVKQQSKATAKWQGEIRGCGALLSSSVISFIQGIPNRDGSCSLVAVLRDESPNSPVPQCLNDQYQFEWAADARPLCLDRNDDVTTTSSLLLHWLGEDIYRSINVSWSNARGLRNAEPRGGHIWACSATHFQPNYASKSKCVRLPTRERE